MPAWRKAVNRVKRLAKRSFANGQCQAKSRNMKRLVDVREGQLFSFVDEFTTRPFATRKRYFRPARDQPMKCHRAAPRIARHTKVLSNAAGHNPALRRYCPLGQTEASGGPAVWGRDRFVVRWLYEEGGAGGG